ncbi:MAG: RcnB family protein [Alphaproteobacteria bacterium]|nr:RcnB family protein [Alphaproteobacteria bacterium]
MRKFTLMAVIALSVGAGGWATASRSADAASVEVGFSLNEKQIISRFFADEAGGDSDGANPQDGQGKGKGKEKKKKNKGVGNQGMPPGLAKKGGALPPGIAKRQLPTTLLSQLPPPPQGFERVIVDKDVVLVNIATQVVHDVLEHVLK